MSSQLMKHLPASILPLTAMIATTLSGATPKPVLLDVDPGIDDALAILLALRSPELKVVGITVVAGNVEVDLGLQNALKLVELLSRPDVPVARGAAGPLVDKLITSKHVHGENGLGNVTLPTPTLQARPGGALELIAEKVEEYAGEITLVPVGPLTNIAMVVKQRPYLVPKIKEIVLMGGSVSGGNITAAAEFNIFNDPEAADIVFRSGIPITMVGLDVTLNTVLTPEHTGQQGRSTDRVRGLVLELIAFHRDVRGAEGIVLHDPLAVGVAIDPSFVRTEAAHVAVETQGGLTRGQTIVDRRGYAVRILEGPRKRTAVREAPPPRNARVSLRVEAERFLRFFVDRVLGAQPD